MLGATGCFTYDTYADGPSVTTRPAAAATQFCFSHVWLALPVRDYLWVAAGAKRPHARQLDSWSCVSSLCWCLIYKAYHGSPGRLLLRHQPGAVHVALDIQNFSLAASAGRGRSSVAPPVQHRRHRRHDRWAVVHAPRHNLGGHTMSLLVGGRSDALGRRIAARVVPGSTGHWGHSVPVWQREGMPAALRI